ncbi:oxidoreductase domain protein [Thermotoga sp. Mc24]|uniref:Gfo/Idh/MocA family protein n=1 Tax=Thermotoga sp. Mc24 TaxID=1231241 RepID=UPI000541CA3A|nr:Gfo/Idh/MocA family oxidoreductase [Thermotoga sp. Mc24]KHC90400.1 oxidoreductase domain protein [Thermotoga sp. Mc24]
MKLRIALVGCGRIGQKKHVPALIEARDLFETVVVCDLVEERANRAAEQFERSGLRRPETTTNYRELLKREDVDVISIATESGKHYQITMEALEAGKHVLVEKPMALSTKHMNEMVELSKRKNLKLGVFFQNRFNPPVQEVRKKLDSGAFGKIFYASVAVRWNRNEDYYKQASWRGTWEMDGGVLMNQSTHAIDLLQWFLGGEIEEIYGHIANTNHPYIEAEDEGFAIVKFKGGKTGLIEATSNVFPRNLEETLAIFGEKGTVVIGGLAVNRILTWRFEGEEGHPFMNLPDPDTVYGDSHKYVYRDFYEAVTNDRKPYISGEDGKKAVEIVLGIYRSFLEGRPVKYPFDFSTEEMKGVKL